MARTVTRATPRRAEADRVQRAKARNSERVTKGVTGRHIEVRTGCEGYQGPRQPGHPCPDAVRVEWTYAPPVNRARPYVPADQRRAVPSSA
jgi:hypothetical protein